jgi:hypothetical protein
VLGGPLTDRIGLVDVGEVPEFHRQNVGAC